MKVGVVVFPGSNCDHDVYHVLKHVLEQDVTFLWHQDNSLAGCELVVLPGGFAYGDYLRAGAVAALSPIMAAIKEHADQGGLCLGICNGFQVLLEAALLPGAMRRNQNLRFQCQDVWLRVERDDLPFTRGYELGDLLRMPIAHAEGNYIDLVQMLGEEIDKAAGRHLTLNVTGALGAVLNEIGFPVEVMRSVAVIGRAAGLVAHICEEKQNPVVPAVVDFINGIEYVDPE